MQKGFCLLLMSITSIKVTTVFAYKVQDLIRKYLRPERSPTMGGICGFYALKKFNRGVVKGRSLWVPKFFLGLNSYKMFFFLETIQVIIGPEFRHCIKEHRNIGRGY